MPHYTDSRNRHKTVSIPVRDEEPPASSALLVRAGDASRPLASWCLLVALSEQANVLQSLTLAGSCWGSLVSVSSGMYPSRLLGGWVEPLCAGLTVRPPPPAPPVKEEDLGWMADKLTLWVVVWDIMPP